MVVVVGIVVPAEGGRVRAEGPAARQAEGPRPQVGAVHARGAARLPPAAAAAAAAARVRVQELRVARALAARLELERGRGGARVRVE